MSTTTQYEMFGKLLNMNLELIRTEQSLDLLNFSQNIQSFVKTIQATTEQSINKLSNRVDTSERKTNVAYNKAHEVDKKVDALARQIQTSGPTVSQNESLQTQLLRYQLNEVQKKYNQELAVAALRKLGIITREDGETALFTAAKEGKQEIIDHLITLGLNLNIQDSSKRTPLMHACSAGHSEIAKSLINADALLNLQDAYGDTALMLAADKNHIACARLLIKAGANDCVENKNKETALLLAVGKNSLDIVKLLMSDKSKEFWESSKLWDIGLYLATISAAKNGCDDILYFIFDQMISKCYQRAYLASHASVLGAAKAGHFKTVKLLISMGCNSTLEDKVTGDTPLIYLLRAGGEQDLTTFLIEHNNDLNHKNKQGYSALMYAARLGQTKAAKALIRCGAKLADGTLGLSAAMGHTETVQALIAAGAKIDSQDSHKDTALIWAASRGQYTTAKYLLEAGAKIDMQGHKNDTALIHAAFGGHHEIVELLLKSGAKPNLRGENEGTALIWAAKQKHLNAVNTLIKYGADLNCQTKYGNTALMIATINGAYDVASALINAKANLELKDKDGYTALERLQRVQQVNKTMVELLKKSGAKESCVIC